MYGPILSTHSFLTDMQFKREDINRVLCYAWSTMGLSFNAIENPFFRKFCELLDPTFTPMSRNTLRKIIVAEGEDVNRRAIEDIEVC